MSYRNTLQADALKLVAKKMQSSLAVEGELPEDGLAAYGDDGDDMMMALARKIVSGDEEDEAETMEDYSVYTMRQASRRSWRIGQTRPVKVVFMAYRGTLQADALKLVAQKLQSSLAVEGELPEDGLAAYGDDGDDIMLELARKIVNGEEEEEGESVEDAFAQARDAEAVSEELLVDEEWHAVEVEVKPETVEVHRNGTGIVVETAAANGHADVVEETQQSMFSWAEFLAEEPPKPSRRNGKPQPASLSLFEWALSLEEEREEEMVGARR